MLVERKTEDLAERLERIERRLAKLEKHSHEPFDFSDLIRRLEALEKKEKGARIKGSLIDKT